MCNNMDYLLRAENYAVERGDEDWFKMYYTDYRKYYNVQDSIYRTLAWLYDEDTAKLLKYQYCEVKL